MKIKIQIKSIDGDVLFEYEKENNTTKDTVEEAVRQKVNLSGANLHWADLRGADFRWAKNVPYIPLNCPSEGSFIGWKKVEGKLVKLEIPEDAKRSSATSNKCRCDIDEILNTSREHELLYKVGEMVYPDSFDEDRWNECSHGIHFFVDKLDAINYFL